MSEQTSSEQGVAMATAAVVKRDDETVVVGLEQGLPRSAVKKHPHTGFDYVDPVYVINTANEVFGYGGWSDEIVVAPHVVKEYTRQKGSGPGSVTNNVAIVACTVRVRAIGTQHDGQGMGTADGPIDTFAGNLDKAFKEAATDAMKRAFIKFGDRFALTLYTKDASSRNIVDDGAPGSGSANGAASSSAGGAAAAGGGFAPPVPQIPDINANPAAHYIARLKTAKSQAEYGEIFQTGLRQTHPAIENEVWEATRSYYDTLPAIVTAAAAPSERPRTSTFTFKFGNDKGIPVAELSDSSLAWYAGKFEGDLADASKAQYHGSTQKNLDAVRAEQAWRKAHGAGPAQRAA